MPPATTDQCFTVGQDEAIAAGASHLATGGFEALADAHLRRQRGQATAVEIAFLDATPEWEIEDALEYLRVVMADRRRIADDLRRHGQRAHAFYREVRPHDYAAVTGTSTALTVKRRHGRAEGGRPARRRTASSSRTSSADPGEPAAHLIALGPGTWGFAFSTADLGGVS